MDRKKAYRVARRHYGIPKFEKNCRLTEEINRLKKAYKVPGTKESGEYATLCRYVQEYAEKLIRTHNGN